MLFLCLLFLVPLQSAQFSNALTDTSSPNSRDHDTGDPDTTRDPDVKDPDTRGLDTDITTSLPHSNSSNMHYSGSMQVFLHNANSMTCTGEGSRSHNIIAEDSVSYSSKMSEGPADPDAGVSERSNCAYSKGTSVSNE